VNRQRPGRRTCPAKGRATSWSRSWWTAVKGVLDPQNPAGGFLMKDLILLGAALYTAGEALQASQ
jgi:hypothetical protein